MTSARRKLDRWWVVALAGALCLSAPALAEERILEPAPGPLTRELSLPAVLGAGAAAAAVSVPAGLLLGTAIGTLPSNLFLAALPSLLVLAALPPLAVTWACYVAGNWRAPGMATFRPAVWVALAAHLAAMVAAGYAGFSSRNLGHLAAFTAAESALLPAAVALSMWTSSPRDPGDIPSYLGPQAAAGLQWDF
ncbi:MAG: hypothetical protein HYZ28_03500 [Myxococcales bacterium]|nr:hypothetical protein [Myxococcales bacterium]